MNIFFLLFIFLLLTFFFLFLSLVITFSWIFYLYSCIIFIFILFLFSLPSASILCTMSRQLKPTILNTYHQQPENIKNINKNNNNNNNNVNQQKSWKNKRDCAYRCDPVLVMLDFSDYYYNCYIYIYISFTSRCRDLSFPKVLSVRACLDTSRFFSQL